jgi:hypothetical protein
MAMTDEETHYVRYSNALGHLYESAVSAMKAPRPKSGRSAAIDCEDRLKVFMRACSSGTTDAGSTP